MLNLFKKEDSRKDKFIEALKTLSHDEIKCYLTRIDFSESFFDKSYPLHLLCSTRDYELTKFAVEELKVDVNVKDGQGYTPTDYAYFHGEFRMGAYTEVSQKLVKLLKKHNGKIKS